MSLDADTFTYAAGQLHIVSSGKWTQGDSGGDMPVIAGGVVRGDNAFAVITTWAGDAADHYSEVTIGAAPAGSDFGGPLVRSAVGTRTYYWLNVYEGGTSWRIYETVAGTYTALATATQATVSGDVCRLAVQGTALTATLNGATVMTATGTGAIVSGKPGMFAGPASAETLTFTAWAADNTAAAITGTLDQTLAAATLTGTATVALQGVLTATLAAATLTATGVIGEQPLLPPAWIYGDTVRVSAVRSAASGLTSVTCTAPTLAHVEGH